MQSLAAHLDFGGVFWGLQGTSHHPQPLGLEQETFHSNVHFINVSCDMARGIGEDIDLENRAF